MKDYSICLLLTSCALLMSTSLAAPHSHKLGLKTTVRLPVSCYCQQVKTEKKGTCFYFTDKKTSRCSSRDCKPGFECASRTTNMLCMRKKALFKVVEVGTGTCTEKPINLWQYVPYASSGGPAPPTITIDVDYDRGGADYKSYDVKTVAECVKKCMAQRRCKSYAFVKAYFRNWNNASAKCFLKERVPARSRVLGVTSGVKPSYK